MNKFPRYFVYPGDGYNNWKFIVQTDERTFKGTTRVYPSGELLDPITTCFIKVDPSWKEFTFEAVVEDCSWVFERSSGYAGYRNLYTGEWRYADQWVLT